MADAIVSDLVREVLTSLTSAAIQEVGRLWKLEADVADLKDTYTQIQDVFNDAEAKQREQKDVETWLKTLRSASLEVENILDLFVTEAMLRRLRNETEKGMKYKVRAFFSSKRNPLMVRARIAHKVKTIRRKLDGITANKSKFNLISNAISTVDSGDGGEITKMETTSLVGVSEVYGRDAEMEMVVDKICSKDIVRDDIEGVWVYAIWGMGGVGKTTLAQLVYNNDRVREHFELQSWVYVSDEFDVKKLARGIIESIDSQCQVSQLDAMQKHLQDKLKGKRFFIVLDDVWIEDRDTTKWEELNKALSSGAEGSIVMVTTRNQTTSRMMAKVPEFQHNLGCLSKEESWSLFKKLAFAPGREGENIRELESIGKEIVDKCKGLPLAVKTLGGLMWSKRSASEWRRVKDSDAWELEENDILPALKLSYDNLLPYLKRCFSYCCLFPKGYEIRKDILIELWMANNFIPLRGEADSYHVIGEEIFNCLVSRSFFQDVQVDKYSLTMDLVCKMHDLMHDLAQDVRRHDSSIIKPGKELITFDELLHLSSSYKEFSLLDQDLKRLRSLRSIIIFGDDYKGSISQIFQHVYLRVLCLDGFLQLTLPESICELKHLRYLSLSNSEICFLPESIIYLQNLQVLLVRRCPYLYNLPEGMRYMKNLRCLDNRGCYRLECMPVGIKELTCLRRLGRFDVGKKKGARIGELGDLNLLGCGLELVRLENVGGLEDAKSANLKCKGNLTYLALCWSDSTTLENEEEMLEEVLEGLEPNSSLEKLDIINYMGKMISPSWMINLGNLVMITFWHCERCESIPSLGKLPSLRVMNVVMMNGLKCFRDDEFPSLHELNIFKCPMLVSLPSNLPKLIRLYIQSCPELQYLPDGLLELPSLWIRECKHLRESLKYKRGEDWLVPPFYLPLNIKAGGIRDLYLERFLPRTGAAGPSSGKGKT